MEFKFLLWLFITFFFTVFCWKCFLWLSHCFKWIIIYSLLKWRNILTEVPEVPLFSSKKEEYLEKPRIWTKNKTFQRDSMLVFAGGKDVWLLLELARGCHNSAVARLTLHLRSTGEIFETPDDGGGPRACESWITDCLALECLEPMRRWRIVFTGRLLYRDQSGQKGSKLIKINLIWASLCGPYFYRTDADLLSLVSSLAAQPLSHLQHNLDSLGKGYEQWGTVTGTVNVEDKVTSIHAPSLRRHSWKWPHATARVGLVGVADNGTLFSLSYTFGNMRTQLGHVRYSNGRVESIVGTSTIETNNVAEKFVRTFSSSCSSHLTYFVRSSWLRWGGFEWSTARCVLDSHPAVCLVLSWDRSMKDSLPLLPLLTWSLCESNELVLTLNHPACSNPNVVGGKAASLALLAKAAHSSLKHKVVVPKGFCLTVHAMQLQLQSSQSLTSAVKYLSFISADSQSTDLHQECQHVETAWLTVPMCATVTAILTDRVCDGRSYAVRSSGCEEDCADTCSAGQNATVLGCVGLHSVVAAVHKCWASLYSFQSVQYRRQAGLPVVSAMGVVVQEIVAAESAGVMFTRHPVTADPHQLLITANYGLGETVVSGNVEPDTIIVNTEDPKNLKLESIAQGRKDRKLAVTDDGEINVEQLGPEMADSLCLTKPEMMALAKVGLSLEKLFGWPRDIEWALNKGVIYLLQCRPVTSLFTWTQDELTHELDTAIMPGEATTTANVGEVLPGATSPLCQSSSLRALDFDMVYEFAGVKHSLWYNNVRVVSSHQCSLLHLYNTILHLADEEPTVQQKSLEVAVCGHRVSTPALQKVAAQRKIPLTLLQKLRLIIYLTQQILMSSSETKKAEKLGKQFRMNCDSFTSSVALYTYMTSCFKHMMMVFKHHCRVCLSSTLWQTILFSILAEGKKELSQENIQDIARILVGKERAISAQIPADIKELALTIKGCDKWKEVVNMSPSKVPTWLELHNPRAFKVLQNIIQRYQHRSNKELDVMTETWGLDCRPLVAAVQSTLKRENLDDASSHNSERRELDSDIMDHLKSPLKLFNRWLLHRLLGIIRSEAARREVTKDACLRVVHQFRLGFLRLAQLMTSEGRLPSPQLIWFTTYYELAQLLNQPHPSLLYKIKRRQHNWQQWDRQQFPEVMTGPPKPLQVDIQPLLEDKGWVQGTLVCAGKVTGRACVLLSCADSNILRPGDILVTHSTDVGWTPLFPLLAGIVTELGGLISHGAVVAREYGLPCIVGATQATLIFKTGDELYLDGQTGKVQKISSTA